MVKKIVQVIVLAIAIGVVALTLFVAIARPACAYEPVWDKWNASPYALSFEMACAKAKVAIDGFNIPQAVKEYFKNAFLKDGEPVWLTPDMLLEEMWTGGAHPHVMSKKLVGELPVLRSPDGRKYRRDTVAETAKALSWSRTYEGKNYVLYLPLVCFNWCWSFGSPPAPPPEKCPEPAVEKCATVKYIVEPNDEVSFAVFARELLPSSSCWQLCDGDNCTALPSPCGDDCNWVGPKSVLPTGFEPLHSGKYVARAEKQALRFPLGVEKNYVAICVTRDGKQSDSWIVQPSAWGEGKTIVVVPYGGQDWPAWGKVDWSKWPDSR